jgi:hypothetical protein
MTLKLPILLSNDNDLISGENDMRNLRMLSALTATIFLLSFPAAAFDKGPPPKKPPMTNKNANNGGKSAQHGVARNLVATGKAVAQRGKLSLQAQRDNLIRLIGRAEGLKPQRRQLRRMARDATNAYRANPNPATRAAWKAAVAAYMPVRQAHESARGQRDAANLRYQLSKSQRAAAIKAAASAAGAAAPRPPAAGRPRIRRQAFIAVPQSIPTASASPKNIYSNVGLVQRPQTLRPEGHYATSASAFKFKADDKSHYSSLTGAEAGVGGPPNSGAAQSGAASAPPVIALRRQPTNEDDLPYAGGKTPIRAFNQLPRPIVQNIYDDV